MILVPRETPAFAAANPEHEAGRRGGRRDPAGLARLLSRRETVGRSGGLHRLADLRPVGNRQHADPTLGRERRRIGHRRPGIWPPARSGIEIRDGASRASCSHAPRGNTLPCGALASLRAAEKITCLVPTCRGRGASRQCVPTQSVGTREWSYYASAPAGADPLQPHAVRLAVCPAGGGHGLVGQCAGQAAGGLPHGWTCWASWCAWPRPAARRWPSTGWPIGGWTRPIRGRNRGTCPGAC